MSAAPAPSPGRNRTRVAPFRGVALLIAVALAGGGGAGLAGCDDESDGRPVAASTAPTVAPPSDSSGTTGPAATAATPSSTAAAAAGSSTTPPATAARRIPSIEAAGDLDAQPSAAGPPTSAGGLAASFELGLDRQATSASVVGLTWPAQSVPGFDHYVVLRRTEPGLPDEVAVAQQPDPAATTFSQDLATTVEDGTSTVSFRAGVIDRTGALVKVSTTLTLRLRWQ